MQIIYAVLRRCNSFFFLSVLGVIFALSSAVAKEAVVKKAPPAVTVQQEGTADMAKLSPNGDQTAQAKKFIQDLGDEGIKKLTGSTLTEAQRRQNFEELFVEKFDYRRIGQFVLGRYRKAAKDRMEEYLKLFKDTIVRTYAARFGEYNNEKFKATSVVKNSKSHVVKSHILRPNNSKVLIEWHMYIDKDGQFKIYDVVVEGVSMALTQRSEYGAIITNKGGIDGLIEQLKRNPPKATFPTQSSGA